MSSRRRALPFSGPGAHYVSKDTFISGQVNVNKQTRPAYAPVHLQGTQVTESENHPNWKSAKASSGDVGGPFSTRKRYTTLKGGNASIYGEQSFFDGQMIRSTSYRGLCIPLSTVTEWPPFADSSEMELNAVGTQAIARCKPTNIFTDLSASLGEVLTQGIPKSDVSRWKDIVDAARKTAGNYLSVEFGFKPVINDILNVSLALDQADAAIQQYVRDSGKTVRRRYDFPTYENESSTSLGSVYPYTAVSDAITGGFFSPGGTVIRTRKTRIDRWFSGAFTYHLPLDDSLAEMSAAAVRARGLINLDLTPETIWNLAPWSWAVDWLVPVGDYISNLQDWSQDGLVLRYGYIMEHSTCSDSYTYLGKNQAKVGILTQTSESKKRIRANPFGFGMSWDGLSPRQLAILAALGISRS